MKPSPVRHPQRTKPRIWLDRGRDSHPAEAGLAAQERRAEDSLSMTRRILLCREQTPRCKRDVFGEGFRRILYHSDIVTFLPKYVVDTCPSRAVYKPAVNQNNRFAALL